MDKNRLWVIGAVLVIGAVVVLGWGLGISPKLTELRAYEAERDTTMAQNAVYEAQIVALKAQFEDIDALRDDLSDVQLAVPGAAEIPGLVTQLTAIAATSQVVVSAFTPNDAQAYDPALLAVTAPVEPSTTVPAPTTGAGAVAVADAVAVAEPTVDPRITATNFVAIPISITVDGPYDNVLDFVSGLQYGQRLVMVTAVSTTVPTPEGTVSGTITALVYVLLDPDEVAP
ncbi:hypothetical protein GY21_00835 [Cryobacterium roopkundense]|uniref:Tfp pilus assembly protein PilO n=1 Tax=Cryobacterium roopkundense TaxID=1001240 RepID=A0A099JY80_9MICO|nr:hypothetical protein [Cryobacterium roopkundense]KGJ82348.1 hypothetical protein GY21_00835 [Cryobacterium roopkundense]MBB5639510.1 Tfp pilus assembly protein PilO [Cryobacterium roopkundense]